MAGKLLMNLSYRELALLGEMLAIQMDLAMYPSHDRAFEDMRMAQKLSYLMAHLRRNGQRAIVINLSQEVGEMCKEHSENNLVKPDKPMEADSVEDTPIGITEGEHLLKLLRSEALMSDDFELELNA